MHIDLERLNAERGIDPFAHAPIDILESLEFTAAVLRDSSLSNPEVMKRTDKALSRVRATNTTPRMRQLLAVMGWVPLDPASDERWILDEPVELPAHANALVADFTAKYYAEGMTLLFSPHDGLFEGYGMSVRSGTDQSASTTRAEVKLMAERRFVAVATTVRFCPAKILHHRVQRDTAKINPARVRCGLPALAIPSISTVQRWCRQFGTVYAQRDGMGSKWKSHLP